MLLAVCNSVSCNSTNESIKIKGSDTEVNLSVQLAEAFHVEQQSILISISGGGSGLGIASLLNGTADIANSSRRMKLTELELFNKENIQIDSFIFAQDAIAFVVSTEIPIDSITIETLKMILSGSINNWNEITSVNKKINIYGRQSNSGTHEFIKDKLNIEFSDKAKEMNGNAQILEAIKYDHSGIGYVGAGYVSRQKNSNLKVLCIKENDSAKSVSPLDAVQIANKNYYFQRPLYQYYKKSSFEKIKELLAFEQNLIGMNIIQEAGYYPVNK
jgi:phosphate transport system substrate-binding protein